MKMKIIAQKETTGAGKENLVIAETGEIIALNRGPKMLEDIQLKYTGAEKIINGSVKKAAEFRGQPVLVDADGMGAGFPIAIWSDK